MGKCYATAPYFEPKTSLGKSIVISYEYPAYRYKCSLELVNPFVGVNRCLVSAIAERSKWFGTKTMSLTVSPSLGTTPVFPEIPFWCRRWSRGDQTLSEQQ
jgi:hypothetical protein